MSDQEEFEACKQKLIDFCDWVILQDRKLQTELREMRARHAREADAHLASMLSRAERST